MYSLELHSYVLSKNDKKIPKNFKIQFSIFTGEKSASFHNDAIELYIFQVENAVKHCLEFSAARKVPFDLMSDISEAMSRASLGRFCVEMAI